MKTAFCDCNQGRLPCSCKPTKEPCQLVMRPRQQGRTYEALVQAQAQVAALREELATLRDQHAEQSCVFCNNSGELLTKVKTLEEERSRTTETLIQYEQGFWGRIASKNRKEADDLQQRLAAAEQRNTNVDIESAAKVLANCMDYPWEHMPENGRTLMRKHAKDIVDAALKPTESGASE